MFCLFVSNIDVAQLLKNLSVNLPDVFGPLIILD